ncbi:tetratricopeptide repeat protein [Desulfoscipio gibsoniae]|uniref:Tetratricopeptide repeat protein n=1 Tax=Desulfoscipio gibsoniae DSM 7213 TaxID=767817 RepID=R4KTY7_9FIRM|nr:tetratricopeptide repeat protein [Desulfoscipio gibsoniae]AGL03066.1 Protein of unknown function, DUF654 [Desulfoscipio gibsoniae DSM 7213]
MLPKLEVREPPPRFLPQEYKDMQGCDGMERNIAKHVLADVFMVTHNAKGRLETKAIYELLKRSYRSRQMEWHEECLQSAWEQYQYWLKSGNSSKIPARQQPGSRLRKKDAGYSYPIRLEKRGRNEWEFAWPSEMLNLMAKFDLGCERMENDDYKNAKRIFNSIIKACPYFIEAYLQLAVMEWNSGNLLQADGHYSQALEIGRSVLPANFRGKLPWEWEDNQPFLSTIYGLAMVKLRRGDTQSAKELLNWLIKLEPGDCFNARSILEDIKRGKMTWDD